MGFFGFLNKKPEDDIIAPAKPPENLQPSIPPPPGDPQPAPSVPDTPPASPEVSQTPEIPDDSFGELGADTPKTPDHPIAPDELPVHDDVHNDDDLSEFKPPAPESPPTDAPTAPDQLAAPADTSDAPLPETSPAPEKPPAAPVSAATDLPDRWDAPGIMESDDSALPIGDDKPEPVVEEKKPAPVELPDFSEAEIEAAEKMSQPVEPVHRQEELPSLDDMTLPPKLTMESLYVPAIGYREALTTVRDLKKAAQKGDAAMDKLNQSIAQHKEKFGKYADTLNTIQEQLVQLDNTLATR